MALGKIGVDVELSIQILKQRNLINRMKRENIRLINDIRIETIINDIYTYFRGKRQQQAGATP